MSSNPLFWKAKSFAERVPGAFRLYKFLTSRTGEGRVYQVARGPVKGLVWRRYNALPYWYHTGRYEPQLTDYIQANIPEGGIFWDIGAHAGYHAITAARAVGPAGQVIAVEPDPRICGILREQIALNSLHNCTVVEAAVSSAVGTTTFYVNTLDSRTSTIKEIGGRGRSIDVATTTLDALLDHHPRPDMLKMDIEGAEIVALPGGKRLFEPAHRPSHILLGVHGQAAKEFALRFLSGHGYQFQHPAGFDDDITIVATWIPGETVKAPLALGEALYSG